MSATTTQDESYITLKQLYHSYRHTEHIPSKAGFFSPTLMQVCRPMPNYCAVNRNTVIQYLLEAAGFKDLEDYERAKSSSAASESTSSEAAKDEEVAAPGKIKVKALQGKSYYSIRPLKSEEELEVLPDNIVAPLSLTPAQLDEQRRRESWVGMRVDLWDDEGGGKGRLIRVKYWWRKEAVNGEEEWMQCLHDIVSIGERDGSEGKEGEVLE